MLRYKVFAVIVLGALLLSACATPTAAPTATVAPQAAAPATAVPAPTNTPVPAPTETPVPPTATVPPAPTAVATIPEDKLVQKGHLTVCTDFPYPPQEYFDENGVPQGLDIELGNEIANRLGLKVNYLNSVFDSIIAAVTSGKCDVIISAMNITPERNKQVSMIPYFKAGQSFVTLKGNPNKITGPADLCGKAAAAESGTTEADYLQNVVSKECEKAGKKPVDVVVTQKDSDALQQLQAGKVVIYSADSPVAAYYTVQHPDLFEVVGQVLEPALEGINMPCGEADCTKAPLTEVGQAVQAALKSMMDDGAYLKILTKWNLASSAVTP